MWALQAQHKASVASYERNTRDYAHKLAMHHHYTQYCEELGGDGAILIARVLRAAM